MIESYNRYTPKGSPQGILLSFSTRQEAEQARDWYSKHGLDYDLTAPFDNEVSGNQLRVTWDLEDAFENLDEVTREFLVAILTGFYEGGK